MRKSEGGGGGRRDGGRGKTGVCHAELGERRGGRDCKRIFGGDEQRNEGEGGAKIGKVRNGEADGVAGKGGGQSSVWETRGVERKREGAKSVLKLERMWGGGRGWSTERRHLVQDRLV